MAHSCVRIISVSEFEFIITITGCEKYKPLFLDLIKIMKYNKENSRR